MTMPTNENPDFIALDMTPTTITPDNAPDEDIIQLDMDDAPSATASDDNATETPVATPTESFASMPSLASALASITTPIAGSVAGSLQDGTMRGVGFSDAQGYVVALQNGVKSATAESYKRTLQSQYNFTAEQIAALTVTIIPEVTGNSGALAAGGPLVITPDGPNIFQQRRIDAGLAPNARMAPRTTAVVQVPAPLPTIDRGLLPRDQILRDLVEESPGVVITMARAERRSTNRPLAEVAAAVVNAGFPSTMAPRRKSEKRQFGEVMRSLGVSELRTWAVTRRDVARTGQTWPESLVARWCVARLDGSDQLGSAGDKILVADLLDNDEIVFTGGDDVLRERVNAAFDLRLGQAMLTATDLLTWFRGVLDEHFNALDCAGATYCPGNSARLESFLDAIRPHMSRRISVWDAVSGASLANSLLDGINDRLDAIQTAYDLDVEKAQDRDVKKHERICAQLGNPVTESDLALVKRRAVVLPERAATHLRALHDAQAYLDGLAKLLGDDTKAAKDRLAALRATIEPLCDATSALGAAIEMD